MDTLLHRKYSYSGSTLLVKEKFKKVTTQTFLVFDDHGQRAPLLPKAKFYPQIIETGVNHGGTPKSAWPGWPRFQYLA